MAKRNLADDPYERLASAIIIQACEDYRAALKRLKANPNSATAKDSIRELERFFYSSWFMELTSLDAKFLTGKLREEIGV